MKLAPLYLTLRRCKKDISHVSHNWSSAEISIFSPEISNFCYIKKYRYKLHFNSCFLIFLTFFEFLRAISINVIAILMKSRKLATIGLL